MDDPGENPNIQKILFDMDGVITSELQYWLSAALSVYEKMNQDMSVKWCEEHAMELCSELFCKDETISILKSLGINTNWDLAYLTYLAYLIGRAEGVNEEELYSFALSYFEELSIFAPELYDYVANEVCDLYNYSYEDVKREGSLWLELQDLFQQWFLGDEGYETLYGKPHTGLKGKSGFISHEIPLVDLNELTTLLTFLKEKGYHLGIGTGRSNYEITTPLTNWQLLSYFDPNRIITYDHVKEGEAEMIGKGNFVSLAKPHPFVFLKGASETTTNDLSILAKQEGLEHCLVVGDAGADLLAAKEAGMQFAAVLTGVAGKNSHDYFQEMGADFIINSVLDLKEIL